MSDKGLADEPRPIAELVDYQEGSVVSRPILKKETGKVIVFAFDQGESLSEHSVPFDAIVHLLDGEAVITVGGKPHTLKQGDVILMPGNVPHAVQAQTRFKMLLIMLRV